MEQKAYLILSHDVEITFDQKDMMNWIQNILGTSKLRNKTFHSITTSPHPHLGTHNKYGGMSQQTIQDIHSIPLSFDQFQ